MTESELAARLARELGALAADAEWSTDATAGQDQGHYTDVIEDAMDAAAVDGDLADATATQLRVVKRVALERCLDRLELHYSVLVDTDAAGVASEKLSQIRAAITAMRSSLSSLGARTAIGVNLRGRRKPDYDVNVGNVVESE